MTILRHLENMWFGPEARNASENHPAAPVVPVVVDPAPPAPVVHDDAGHVADEPAAGSEDGAGGGSGGEPAQEPAAADAPQAPTGAAE